jgi:hypothetical protein
MSSDPIMPTDIDVLGLGLEHGFLDTQYPVTQMWIKWGEYWARYLERMCGFWADYFYLQGLR